VLPSATMDSEPQTDPGEAIGAVDREVLRLLGRGTPHAEIAVRIGTSITDAKQRIERVRRMKTAEAEASVRPAAATPAPGDRRISRASVSVLLGGLLAVAVVSVGVLSVASHGGSDGASRVPTLATPPDAASRPARPASGATPHLRWPIEVYMAGGIPWHEPD
jgi:hypothetical protein